MGCGCNNNFSGQKKQCTCGRNAGGDCQCNQRKLNASGILQQRIKSNKAKFSSFMGSSQNYPQVDTKKYGISDEHYYEYNSPSNVRTGINYNDMDVSF